MDNWVQIIANLGFPIFVALYLLYDKKQTQEAATKATTDALNKVEEALMQVKASIDVLTKMVDRLNR